MVATAYVSNSHLLSDLCVQNYRQQANEMIDEAMRKYVLFVILCVDWVQTVYAIRNVKASFVNASIFYVIVQVYWQTTAEL